LADDARCATNGVFGNRKGELRSATNAFEQIVLRS
jgi:hypothetical protein